MACGGNGIIPAVRFSGRVLLFCVGGIVSVLVVSYQCWWYRISVGGIVSVLVIWCFVMLF